MVEVVVRAAARIEMPWPKMLRLLAKGHPKKFTNAEEVAASWESRLSRGEHIPYVEVFSRRVLEQPNQVEFFLSHG